MTAEKPLLDLEPEAPIDRKEKKASKTQNLSTKGAGTALLNPMQPLIYSQSSPMSSSPSLAHYESELQAPSYERPEFLGDVVLDMIVTDYLYRAPGKNI